MTRIEFLGELSKKLNRLPKEELDNVLSYYDEVFLDAGVDHEEETAEKLGNIDDIVRQIYVDNNIAPDGEPEYYVETHENQSGETNNANQYDSGTSFGVKLLLIVLTFPIWVSVIAVVSSIMLSIVVTYFALSFAFSVAGVACVVAGVVELFTVPSVGMATLGGGLVLLGLSGLFIKPLFAVIFKGIRALFNVLVSACHNLVEKRRSV